jgi:HNH endonuclease/AP2 domain
MITAERLRELLHYDPDTGIFRWLVSRGNQFAHIGAVAGYISGGSPRDGYRRIRIEGRIYKTSRLAWLYMTGKFPAAVIDHINLVHTDDRFCNLREATASQNNANRAMWADNPSGFKGVTWHKQTGKWRAMISVNKKLIHLGLFASRERAFLTYFFEAWKLFGTTPGSTPIISGRLGSVGRLSRSAEC